MAFLKAFFVLTGRIFLQKRVTGSVLCYFCCRMTSSGVRKQRRQLSALLISICFYYKDLVAVSLVRVRLEGDLEMMVLKHNMFFMRQS